MPKLVLRSVLVKKFQAQEERQDIPKVWDKVQKCIESIPSMK